MTIQELLNSKSERPDDRISTGYHEAAKVDRGHKSGDVLKESMLLF